MQAALPIKPRSWNQETPFFESLAQSMQGRMALAVSATIFVALCAHVSVSLPFTPVPLTLSDFAVLVVGMLLGPALGFSTMVLYLAEGATGLPVFNPQGPGGLAHLIGPTAGYLFAYPVVAAVAALAGNFVRKNMSAFSAAIIAGTMATAVLLISGAGWIAHLRFLPVSAAWTMAVAPFLYGAGAKVAAAAIIFSSTRRWFRA